MNEDWMTWMMELGIHPMATILTHAHKLFPIGVYMPVDPL